jgi:hypothetical protein
MVGYAWAGGTPSSFHTRNRKYFHIPQDVTTFDFFSIMYFIQHCFICRPSDSTVSEDAGIEAMTVETLALTLPPDHSHYFSFSILGDFLQDIQRPLFGLFLSCHFCPVSAGFRKIFLESCPVSYVCIC